MNDIYLLHMVISMLGINLTLILILINIPLMTKIDFIFLTLRSIALISFHMLVLMLFYDLFYHNPLTYILYIFVVLILFILINLIYGSKIIKFYLILFIIISYTINTNLIDKLMFINIIILLYEIYEIYEMIKKRNTFISRNTIKQAFDTMDDGLLFVNEECMPLLMNNKMINILNEFESFYKLGNSRLIHKIIENISNSLIKVNDKTYSVFVSESTDKHKGFYYQFVDVSDSYKFIEQLENQNQFLLLKQSDLKNSLKNIEKSVTDNEVLKLRLWIHDIIGQRLSIVHTYIENNFLNTDNINELKEILKNIKGDLNFDSYNIDERFNRIKITYEVVNTILHLNGSFPNDNKVSTIFLNIIREASTNAIRHSSAKNVYIDIKEDKENLYLNIKNDGKVNTKNIVEGDGILGMRRAIKPYEGVLNITTDPLFQIDIKLKRSNLDL